MKLYPPSEPLEDVAIDLLGQLWPTDRGHTQLLVIVDRFTKMVRAIPLKTASEFDVAKVFTRHLAFAYGISKTVLTDNGKQFNAKFLQQAYRIIGGKPQFTTTYHSKANDQTERFNRTILSSIRRFIAEHSKDWDIYTDMLTYAYDTQAHFSTGYAPMELTISRLPLHMAMENYSKPTKNVRLARDGASAHAVPRRSPHAPLQTPFVHYSSEWEVTWVLVQLLRYVIGIYIPDSIIVGKIFPQHFVDSDGIQR
eukprot:IDg9252t1